jgi:SAM-dependent methyltransferase
VLEHVNDDIMCLRELRRILKPGGALAVLIPVNERFEDPNHFRRYTSSSFRHICEAEGFAYISGFENELLYYLVETMYWKHADGKWPFLANAVRVLFNILTSRLPFWCYGVCDIIIGRLTGLPPRQSAMLFVKRDG